MNKMKIRKLFYLLMVGLLLGACDEDTDNNPPQNQLGAGSWSMGNYIYQRGTSVQNTSKPISNGQNLRAFVITTSGTGNLGVFSGSSITGYNYELGAGDYQVVDKDFFFEKGHTGKYIHFNCQIGTGTATGSTQYTSQNSNEIIKVTIKDGSYVYTTTQEVVLNKGLEVNGGVAGATNKYAFKANSIF